MRHLIIYFYADGSMKRHRLARRFTTLTRVLEDRNDLRLQALELYQATCESRVRPQLRDIMKLVVFDGHTKIQEIPFIEAAVHPE